MSIEVIKQALEALEMYLKLDTMDEAHILEVEIAPKAITALRAAIEQAEKPVAWQGVHDHTDLYYRKPPQADVRPLYTTSPAAPRQDHYDQTSLELCKECGWRAMIPGDGCLVCARQKAKPVAWMYDFLADDRDEVIRDWITQSQDEITRENGFNVRPLYGAPRQWVGLTEEEIEQGKAESWVSEQAFESAVWWAEAKLREKNT
jgi:hypothetical protein